VIELHPDWQLVKDLDRLAAEDWPHKEIFVKASRLIRELKRDLSRSRDKTSRLQFPDTSGQ
jgi:hypothetical protein